MCFSGDGVTIVYIFLLFSMGVGGMARVMYFDYGEGEVLCHSCHFLSLNDIASAARAQVRYEIDIYS